MTLSGDVARLKERLIGIEVFGRAADYNTADDPIVRITIAEIRKRIAQYYHEGERSEELRIALEAGSYIPEFHFPKPLQSPQLSASSSTEPEMRQPSNSSSHPVSSERLQTRRRYTGLRWLALGLAVAAILTVSSVGVSRLISPSPAAAVLSPLRKGNSSVFFCIGRPGDIPGVDTQVTSLKDHINQVNAVTFDDVLAFQIISEALHTTSRDVSVKSSVRTSFSDLQRSPTVLIGGLDNTWALHVMKYLPYQIDRIDGSPRFQIVNHRKNEINNWIVDFRENYTELSKDYAIVARFQNPETDQPTLLIAGIGSDATKAAAEYLTNPNSLKPLAAVLTKNKDKKNFEIVIESQIINGASGPPRLLTTTVW